MSTRERLAVRETNLLHTFEVLRSGSEMTTAELTAATGLSRPTIESLTATLIELGWVTIIDPVPDGTGGRPPQRFRFRAEAGTVLGIDIGVHRVAVVVADLVGTTLTSYEAALVTTSVPEDRLTRVDDAVTEALSRAGVLPQDVWSLAAAITGPVNRHGRTTAVSPLPGWTDVDLVAHFSSRFSCQIQIENDVKMGLLAEHEWGQVSDSDDVVYVLTGPRTGAAAMVNGSLVRGHEGFAGEIGALPAVRWGSAVDELLRLPGANPQSSDLALFSRAFEETQRGNAQARRLVAKYSRDVATGAAALILTLDPEVVAIGGLMTRWAPLWIPQFRRSLTSSVIRMPDVRVSTLDADHVARGATGLALHDVRSRYFDTHVKPVRKPQKTP